MLQGWRRTFDVHRSVRQRNLWKRIASASDSVTSAQGGSDNIFKRPVEPGPEDCCQVSRTIVLSILRGSEVVLCRSKTPLLGRMTGL